MTFQEWYNTFEWPLTDNKKALMYAAWKAAVNACIADFEMHGSTDWNYNIFDDGDPKYILERLINEQTSSRPITA